MGCLSRLIDVRVDGLLEDNNNNDDDDASSFVKREEGVKICGFRHSHAACVVNEKHPSSNEDRTRITPSGT